MLSLINNGHIFLKTCLEPHRLIYHVCGAHVDKSLQGLDTPQFYEQWHINFANEKLRNRAMENTLACMTKFFMQHSTYSTYDKVKHTIKLLLLVYKDQYMLS